MNKDTPQSNADWLKEITWLGSPLAERLPNNERLIALIHAAQKAEAAFPQLLEAEKKRWREIIENEKIEDVEGNWRDGKLHQGDIDYNQALDAVLQKLS